MKAFTDLDALHLGQAILNRFEEGLNGKEWLTRSVVIPIQLKLSVGNAGLSYPHDGPWCSSVELRVPYFVRHKGPFQEVELITLDEWLKDQESPDETQSEEKK